MPKKKKTGAAKTMPMRALEDKTIPYEPRQQSHKHLTAAGVADDLGVPVSSVVKAMIVQKSDRTFALVVIPGDRQLSLKKLGAELGDKSVTTAQPRDVQRVTGFQVGAVSVIGFRRSDIPSYVDGQVTPMHEVIISSGRADLGLALSATSMLEALDGAIVGDFCS